MKRSHGFTLLELLVVLVIAGILLGAGILKALPDARQKLHTEVERIALLLQAARDEAIVRNRPVAFEVDSTHYYFLIQENNAWQALSGDELLRERFFQAPPITLSIQPPALSKALPLRVVFGREPVDKPFTLNFSVEGANVSLRADGLGHFAVE